MDLLSPLFQTLAAWLLLAVPVVVVCAALWLRLPPNARKLLPPQRHRLVPWTGLEVCLLFLMQGLLPDTVYQGLLAVAGESGSGDKLLLRYSAFALAFPLFLVCSWLLLRLRTRTRPSRC